MTKLLLIAAAGALGALARYGLAGLVHEFLGRTFPWGTVVVNITGCLAFGLLWSAMEDRLSITSDLRAMILVGFMGAFTTFSSFAFETVQLIRDAEWLLAAGNVTLQNAVGIAALFAGMIVGRMI
jgi:CrcB protein